MRRRRPDRGRGPGPGRVGSSSQGSSTGHLDRVAERFIREGGCHPVVQGLPRGEWATAAFRAVSASLSITRSSTGSRASGSVRTGQIVSVDAGAILDGWHGDAARTFVVGEPTPEIRELVDTTRLAMMAGIAAAVPGNRIGDISAAIEDVAPAVPLRHRSTVRRPRHRHGNARGAPGPELPDRGPGHGALSPESAWPSSRCSPSAQRCQGHAPTVGPS